MRQSDASDDSLVLPPPFPALLCLIDSWPVDASSEAQPSHSSVRADADLTLDYPTRPAQPTQAARTGLDFSNLHEERPINAADTPFNCQVRYRPRQEKTCREHPFGNVSIRISPGTRGRARLDQTLCASPTLQKLACVSSQHTRRISSNQQAGSFTHKPAPPSDGFAFFVDLDPPHRHQPTRWTELIYDSIFEDANRAGEISLDTMSDAGWKLAKSASREFSALGPMIP